jgi:hypothetical protein
VLRPSISTPGAGSTLFMEATLGGVFIPALRRSCVSIHFQPISDAVRI